MCINLNRFIYIFFFKCANDFGLFFVEAAKESLKIF